MIQERMLVKHRLVSFWPNRCGARPAVDVDTPTPLVDTPACCRYARPAVDMPASCQYTRPVVDTPAPLLIHLPRC